MPAIIVDLPFTGQAVDGPKCSAVDTAGQYHLLSHMIGDLFCVPVIAGNHCQTGGIDTQTDEVTGESNAMARRHIQGGPGLILRRRPTAGPGLSVVSQSAGCGRGHPEDNTLQYLSEDTHKLHW